jgi:ATP-dependent Zn protease
MTSDAKTNELIAKHAAPLAACYMVSEQIIACAMQDLVNDVLTTRAAEADRLLREARDELKEIRDWALVEKAVLREQELESIGEVIDQLEGRG